MVFADYFVAHNGGIGLSFMYNIYMWKYNTHVYLQFLPANDSLTAISPK